MITRQYIGEKLKTFRKSKGLNQQEMADAIGISRAALSTWEKGEKVPNLLSILQLSMTYNISINDLFEMPLSEYKHFPQTEKKTRILHEPMTNYSL